MEVTLLRTLTQKSYLKFGKYTDFRVGELLQTYKFRYLRWIYFNCSKITFTDEILELLNITKEFKIDKPGKCSENHDLLNEILNNNIPKFRVEYLKTETKREKKRNYINLMKRNKIHFSKKSMQRRNHGK